MKNIVRLLTLPLLLSCQNDDDSLTKKVDFTITNALNYNVEGKLYTTSGGDADLRRNDSINFAVNAGEATTVTWNKFNTAGDGLFQLYVNEELNKRFGYVTNGVSLNGSFMITIEPDSIVVQ